GFDCHRVDSATEKVTQRLVDQSMSLRVRSLKWSKVSREWTSRTYPQCGQSLETGGHNHDPKMGFRTSRHVVLVAFVANREMKWLETRKEDDNRLAGKKLEFISVSGGGCD